jgi:hypothetical protein
LLLAACAGCADRGYEKYFPSQDRARQALESALRAWRDGTRPAAVAGTPIEAVDRYVQKGEKIAGYEILKEEANDGPRVFSVQLTLQKPAGKQVTVRYYVLGKDPLWVYREEDFKALSGMGL